MAEITGGQMVVEVLQKEKVEKAFCVPGESYLGIIDGLYEHPSIQLIATRHESGAAFMAEAYAKATGKVGVCMATRGPGATNLSIGLHTAKQDSTPVVALIGQVERPFIGKEAFQEVDFAGYFSHLCKDAIQIDSVDRIPELLHQAFYIAQSGRPGPVVVSLPHDMLEERTEYKGSKVLEFNAPTVDSDTVKHVLEKVQSAKKPFVIAGGGVILSKAEQPLQKFVERVNLPVVSAFRRFNVLANNHEHYVGWLGFGANPSLIKAIQEADVVLVLGTRLSQVTSQDYTLLKDTKQTIIQVDIQADSIGKAFAVDVGIVSDMKLFLQAALSQLESEPHQKNSVRIQTLRRQYDAHATIPSPKGDTAYAELNSVIKDMMDLVPKQSIITSDAGNFYGWLARYFRFSTEKRYIGPTSGAMGYGLPAALGVKVACPHMTVISISGDGGFMMTMQELETAVREEIPIISIVVNNNMYGTIRAHQAKQFPERIMATTLTNPNFADIAKLYGCDGETVTNNASFKTAFTNALQSNVPYVIEVQTDPTLLSVADAWR